MLATLSSHDIHGGRCRLTQGPGSSAVPGAELHVQKFRFLLGWPQAMLALRGLLAGRNGPGLGLLPALPRIDALRFDERGPKLAKKRSLIRTWKIRPGDIVYVNSGKEKKSTGEVLMIDHRRNMLKVKGLNLRKVIDDEGIPKFIEKKIHYSNCALVDPAAGRPTRVGLTFTEDGDAIRISHLTGHIIPWPDLPKHMQKRDEDQVEGPKDTPPEVALRKTYDYHADKEALRLARLAMTKYNYNR
ncbi:MRPL24 [Symbiodinium sp. CCMP2592]|nr:MRPL24 [Symbiodinium sp. CCMP2592]